MKDDFSVALQRNLQGIEYEKQGLVDKAIILYEENIEDFDEGSHPYKRLAIIYHKQKKYEDERRVLEQAVYVFKYIVSNKRMDKEPKLKYFNDRLKKLNKQI